MNITNSEIRTRARKTLGGKLFEQKWLMAIAIYFVVSAILTAASTVSSGVATIIVAGPLMYGMHKTYLTAVRTQNTITFDNAFDGFKNFGQTFLLSFMQSIFLMLWSLLLVIPAIIKTYAYSMAFYILTDHPEYTWRQCLDESQKMMRGYKWQLFCLDFSFIGWYIVGSLCLGIGVLWVYPYHYTARAEFYHSLKGEVAWSEPAADDYN